MTEYRSSSRHVESFDGTRIALYAYEPKNSSDASLLPPIALVPGLGGTPVAWRNQIAFFAPKTRVVTWDYRGTFGSSRPKDPSAFSIDAHVQDALAVLNHEHLDKPALIGWSMGVQVCLELARQYPDVPRSLVLMNGTFGRALAGLPLVSNSRLKSLAPKVSERLVSAFVHAVRRAHGIVKIGEIRRLLKHPEAIPLMKRFGVVGPTLDDEVLKGGLEAIQRLDLDSFLRILVAINEHDAEDTLASLRAPTLVIAGENDAMTPPAAARRIAEKTPGAALWVVPGATHYAAAEYPDLVNARIAEFLRASSPVKNC